MFSLPMITAPACAQPLGDVGVVRGDVAGEDPRSRRALAAANRDKVLEADRHAAQRMERREGRHALVARARQPHVRVVGGRPGAGAVDGEPRVEGRVLALGELEMGLDELAGRDVAGTQAVAHRGGRQAGQRRDPSSKGQSPPRMAGTTT